jgi:hypothetical protein
MHAHQRTLLSSLGFTDRDVDDRRHDLACSYLCEEEPAARLVSVVGWEAPRAWPSPGPLTGTRPCECHGLGLGRDVPPGYCAADWTCDRYADPRTRTDCTATVTRVDAHVTWSTQEQLVQKGEGKYATTIGFLDVLLCYEAEVHEKGIWKRHARRLLPLKPGTNYPDYQATVVTEELPERCWYCYVTSDTRSFQIAIEVKIAPCSTGALLRQMNLYREYVKPQGRQERLYWVAALSWAPSVDDHVTLTDAGITVVTLGPEFERYCADPARKKAATVSTL